MKDIIALEFYSKKNLLGQAEMDTPPEFIFTGDTTDSILNNRIFNDFIDNMFYLVTKELSGEFDEKIDSVYITFINDNNELICSIIMDKFKPRLGVCRVDVKDWQSTGYIFKYAEDEI